MIRINLLPIKAQQKQSAAIVQLVVMGVAVLLSIVAVLIHSSSMDQEIDDRTKNIEAKKAEIKRLEKIIGEVNQFTQTRKALEEKINIIRTLQEGRTGPVRLLDELSQRIPAKVWIVDYQDQDGQLTLKGLATRDDDVALFLGELEKSPYFDAVQLRNIAVSLMQNKPIPQAKSFEITAKVKYAL